MSRFVGFTALWLATVLLVAGSAHGWGDRLGGQRSTAWLREEAKVSPHTAFGDSIWSFCYSEDQGLLGVEFDGEYFYVGGDNDGGDSNMIYVFDSNGKYAREFAQKSKNVLQTDVGWWNLAYRADHDYFFGSDDTMITAFDEFGNLLYKFRGPYNINRGLAWDGQCIWVTYPFLPIVKLDTAGLVVASYANSYWTWGLAWDDGSEGNPWLWVSTGEGPWGNRMYQFDPIKGEYSGLCFDGSYSGETGGLAFSTEWDTTRAVLFGLCQSMPDLVVAYDLGPIVRTIEATVDIKPEVLNLKSKGRWVTCFIELPEGHGVEEIDLSTVEITKIDGRAITPPIPTDGPSSIGDEDGDGIPDLMVKFSRQELISHLQGRYGYAAVFVGGELNDGKRFEGADTLRVIEPPESNRNTMLDATIADSTFGLLQNRPNPVSSSTVIEFVLRESGPAGLSIYDATGKLVWQSALSSLSSGPHSVYWGCVGLDGRHVPAGVYLYRLETQDFSQTKKMVVVR